MLVAGRGQQIVGFFLDVKASDRVEMKMSRRGVYSSDGTKTKQVSTLYGTSVYLQHLLVKTWPTVRPNLFFRGLRMAASIQRKPAQAPSVQNGKADLLYQDDPPGKRLETIAIGRASWAGTGCQEKSRLAEPNDAERRRENRLQFTLQG